jgi:hypothetical protein
MMILIKIQIKFFVMMKIATRKNKICNKNKITGKISNQMTSIKLI